MMRSLRLLFRGRGSKGGSTERKGAAYEEADTESPAAARAAAAPRPLWSNQALPPAAQGPAAGAEAGAPAAGLASTPDAAAPPPAAAMPRPMWSNRAPPPQPEEPPSPAMPPGGMPRPMWSNRKPQPQPEDPPHPALPPGMPKPMWSNQAKAGGAAPAPADGAAALPAGMPKPMWSNRAKGTSSAGPRAESAGMLGGAVTGSGGAVYRDAELPPGLSTCDSDLTHTGGLHSKTATDASCSASPTCTGGGGAEGGSAETARSAGVEARGGSPATIEPSRELSRYSERSGYGEKSTKDVKPKKILPGDKFMYELAETLGKGSYAKARPRAP